ncbi:BrnT family toxin [Candidatus Daviesbacteria bacterium]|nr:BrnT family toxin [Candidatus Daviesbacteria bacterium]
MRVVKDVLEFEWDKGNTDKNKAKHDVEDNEAEEVFLDEHRFVFKDHLHSGNEQRFRILGKTKKGRLLFIVFTKRKKKIRVISARDINKKEVHLYEEKINPS